MSPLVGMLHNYLTFLALFASIFQLFDACPSGWFSSRLDGTKCYLISEQAMSWQEAEEFCRNNGAPFSHLTSVLSAFDTNDISVILAGSGSSVGLNDQVWIGARGIKQNERFEWVDGTPMDYTNWLPGQPNLQYSCVSSLARTNGKWRTEPCETKNYFICKYFMQPTQFPTDCFDWHFANGNSTTGVYHIFPFGSGSGTLDVFCDMMTDGGGWTVFQKRADGTLMFFNRTWMEYKLGFSNGFENSFWLGNDNIHALSTKDATVELWIDLWGDRWINSSSPNGYWFDKYTFYLDNETDFYTLHINMHLAGNASASDPFSSIYRNDGMKFSTVDVDHDNWDGVVSCAIGFETGGWWYDACTTVSLNGKYIPPDGHWHDIYGFTWYTSQSYFINPRQSRMMLRKRIQ